MNRDRVPVGTTHMRDLAHETIPLKNLFAESIRGAAVVIAVAVERFLSHFLRRTAEDVDRLDLARQALAEQENSLDELLEHDLPSAIKEMLIDFAEATTYRESALALNPGASQPNMAPLLL